MKIKCLFSKKTHLIGIAVLFLSNVHGQAQWQEINSVEQVCSAYPERMVTMLHALNLEMDGLENVKQAYESDNIPLACSALLDYYANGSTPEHLRIKLPQASNKTTSYADSIILDIYTFQRITGKVPRLAYGQLKWAHNGPENDIEWAWALNRHYPITYLLAEFSETGNPKYVRYMDSFIKDWIIQSWPYPAKKSSTAMWRGLEVSFRAKVWAKVFYGFMNTGYISPATRLLILSTLSEHAHYARNFHGTTNWLTMEMTGLATIATAWPEFKESSGWLKYTISMMTESLKEQVYPDGAQSELTTHYHRVALNNFYLFYTICKRANIPLSDYFTKQIENMWNYLALIMRPDGNALLNNDADLDYNKDRIIHVAEEYGRKDWQYVATNEKAGTKPSDGPSNIFPWAGHFISRSDYDADAHWSFFDIGPWGSGHQHNDNLHISISAYGRDLLVDAGRFAYRGEVAKKFRGYAKGSQGHNVILIDGKGQSAGPKVVDQSLSAKHFKITPDFDYAWNSFEKFNGTEGISKHTRTMFYVRKNFWVVVDNVETDRPRKVETLWHWHPSCEVRKKKAVVISDNNEKGNLQIIPIGKTKWEVDLIKGQETPEIQGWYSERYNQYEPSVATIYRTEIKSNQTFVWLLVPFESSAPEIQAKLISENEEGLALSVKDPIKGEWALTIPYSSSENAKLNFKGVLK